MRKRVAVCLLVVFAAVFGSAACAGGEGQDVEILEQRMQALEQEVAQLRQLVEGGPPQEQPQPQKTQPQKTQQEKTQ